MAKIKVRIAPSPTGRLHIGTARTALFNYLFARRYDGQFILRIEDTDRSRSRKEYEQDIIEGLKWLGLEWDQGPIRQAERMEQGVYQKHLDRLIKEGFAYPCFCSAEKLARERKQQLARGIPPKYSGLCRTLTDSEIAEKKKAGQQPTYRLNVDRVAKEKGIGPRLIFKDLIRGEIKNELATIGDFILNKRDGTPLYHLAVVIDDHELGISQVIRGEDHITNTFNQLLLYRAFDWQSPEFGHLPLILDQDRSKLSKRKGNIIAIADFKKSGYLPEAMVNYLALLGWNLGEKGSEIFSLEEATEKFELTEVNLSGAIFEKNKLDYLNGWYIRQKDDRELLSLLQKNQMIKVKGEKPERLLKIISLVKNRLRKLSEFDSLTNYFFSQPEYDSKLLIFKRSTLEKTIQGLEIARKALKKISREEWLDSKLLDKVLIKAVTEGELTNGDLFWPVRVALSGREASPSPTELLWALGREDSLARIKLGQEKLGKKVEK